MTPLQLINLGRVLIALSVLLSALNLIWFLGLNPTMAHVITVERPCYYTSGKHRRLQCDLGIRYATADGRQIETIYTAGSQLPIGYRFTGLYHPYAPRDFYATANWWLVPLMVCLGGLYVWMLGTYRQYREKREPSDWVERAGEDIAAARASYTTHAAPRFRP